MCGKISYFKIIFSRLLYDIFLYDIKVPWGVETLSPQRKEFVEYLLPHLAILIQDAGKGGSASISAHPYHPEPTISMTPFVPLTNPSLPLVDSSSISLNLSDPLDRDVIMNDLVNKVSSYKGEKLPEELRLLKKDQSSGEKLPVQIQMLKKDTSEDKAEISSSSQSVGFAPGETEERKSALRMMNTLSRWLTLLISRSYYALPPELYK